MNHLGMTLGPKGIRSAVDQIRSSYDKELIAIKKDVSERLQVRRRLFQTDSK